ncbi:ArsR family transcriptional regulator [Saliphagus sp. GCM10025334]
MDLDPHTEDQLQLLCEGRNRTVCDLLTEADGPLHVTELADQLVARDVNVVNSATYDEKLDNVTFELHHVRLPKLAEVDLVEYDLDANLVSQKPSPASMVEWQDEKALATLVTHLPTTHGSEAGDVGVVEGLDSAFEYARKLADEAEEELFALYATTDLLEDECVRHGERALDRDVTISIGSQNETVRERCREGLPEATVWEPQLDWLNTPTYPRVGRLILIDRRKVMFSVLTEPPSEKGSPEEIALIGDGKENPLVVLVRELLGPRLDHLDYQNDDVRSHLPTYND